MSGAGSPKHGPADLPVDCHDLRVAVVAARWHEQVMDGLLAGARRALDDYEVEQPSIVRVPGSFELPVPSPSAATRPSWPWGW
jgi:6,7-dimethyl-8-ribityllumazine synthase